MTARRYSATDRFVMRLQQALSDRAPDANTPASGPGGLDDTARRHAAGLMRVNHAGEIAAQALYQGQALTARDPQVRAHMLEAAKEEQQHLRWCEERLTELQSRPSALEPVWFAGSYAIGAIAGLAGDRWSLGFVAETERQVAEHLDDHLERLPAADQKSREIVRRMRADETRHGQRAEQAGGRPLPAPIRALMRGVALIMKFGAYRA
jgi:3-demethoxyubiquinol 3-hydroxylase